MDLCKYKEILNCPCRREFQGLILCNHAEYVVNYSLTHDFHTISKSKYFPLICGEFQQKISNINDRDIEVYYPLKRTVQDMESGRIKQGDLVYITIAQDEAIILNFPEEKHFLRFWTNGIFSLFYIKFKIKSGYIGKAIVPNVIYISKADKKESFKVKKKVEANKDLLSIIDLAKQMSFRVEEVVNEDNIIYNVYYERQEDVTDFVNEYCNKFENLKY